MASRHCCICTFIPPQRVLWRTEGLEKWQPAKIQRWVSGGSCYLVMEGRQADFHTFDWEYLNRFSAYVILKFGYHAANYSSLYLFQISFLLRCPGKPLPITAFSELALLLGAGECKVLHLLFGHRVHQHHLRPMEVRNTKDSRIWKNIIWIFQGFLAELPSCSLRSKYKQLQLFSNYFFIFGASKANIATKFIRLKYERKKSILRKYKRNLFSALHSLA